MANTRPRYHTMTAQELREELDELKLGQAKFAMLCGIDPDKMRKICEGRVDPKSGRPFLLPYGCIVLLAYFKEHGMSLAFEVLDDFLIPEEGSVPVD